VNESLAKIHNVPIRGHLGHSFHKILGNFSETIVPLWERVFITGQPLLNLEVSGKLPKRSGTGRWIESLFPLRDKRGRVMQVGCLVIETPPSPIHADPLSTIIPKAISAAVDGYSKPSHQKRTILSAREQEVLRLLAEGKSNKEISSVLAISVRTVETYRARLMLKLRAPSFAHLLHYAIRNHIVKI
jgi:DNA-binding CsgD family transcriptional regulator